MKLRNFSLLILVFLFLFPTFVSAQYFTDVLGKRFKMEDIRSIILEDFETNDKEWTVSASRFTKEGFPQLKSGIEGIPAALTGAYPSAENKYIFGVRSIFTRRGYNKVWIYPSEEIVIPGRAMRLDAWVWGGNYYYNLEAHVRDYTGVVHILPLGSLHFIGWRNLNIDIPKQIPQEMRYLPMEKPRSPPWASHHALDTDFISGKGRSCPASETATPALSAFRIIRRNWRRAGPLVANPVGTIRASRTTGVTANPWYGQPRPYEPDIYR